MIYYTSDLHFGHNNIIKYCNRPYVDIYDMHKHLIQNWNNKVKDNDDVYILGDFAFQNSNVSIFTIQDILRSLKGKKHLIVGNHDQWVNKQQFNPRYFESIDYYKEIKDGGKDIILCHYPIESWNGMEYGSIHLHGHLHDIPTKLDLPNRYNVGCDNWNYEPVSLREILNKNSLLGV